MTNLLSSVQDRFSGKPTVAVLRLQGVIASSARMRSGISLSVTAGAIERAFKQKNLKAVALVINSPGGSPVQSHLVARRIRQMADEKQVPVIAFCEDVAASGGYFIACAADEILVDPSSIVGSIGVVAATFGFVDALEKLGVERRVYTAGDKKVTLDPFQPEQEEDVKKLTNLQKDIHTTFKDFVKERRGDRLKAGERKLFSGEFWTGTQAIPLGLVDGLGEPRTTLRERYGEKVRLKVVNPPRSGRFALPFANRAGGEGLGAGLGAVGGEAGFFHGLGGELLSALEERAWWNRYGL